MRESPFPGIAAIAALLVGCQNPEGVAPAPARERTAATGLFRDISHETGLAFRHDPGVEGRSLLPEITGAGGALFDYDGDGDLDIYLVDGGRLPDGTAWGQPGRSLLLRRETDGTWTDVTESSGAGSRGYGMGCAIGDVDNDGDTDLYLTNYGLDTLLRNEGDGTFSDVTESAGIRGEHWSSSAAFFDYDADGDLDLYVAHYVSFSPPKACTDTAGRPDYCGPSIFPGVPDTLYRNDGRGGFTDVSESAGISHAAGKGLGVFPADFNDDGAMDVYVANDGEENFLWINKGGGRFEDEAMLLGAAVDFEGRPEASMGIAVGDPDLDGDLDIFLTHISRETNTYYRNEGNRWFEDVTTAVGLAVPSLPFTGFGAAFIDVDLDGDEDLPVVNGRVRFGPDALPAAESPDPFHSRYGEPDQLYMNDGTGHFEDAPDTAGEFSARAEVTRGLIPGDLDGDGDLDLLITNCNGPARLFENMLDGGHWLSVRAMDPGLGRDAIGALVTVHSADRRQIRLVTSTGSYLSAVEPVAHFGLGGASSYERIDVRWPDGLVESFPAGASNRLLRLVRGAGSPLPRNSGAER